jgi:flavin reductase (DIM6/NTAB) family NADH-FMN oxidoreductase RutF
MAKHALELKQTHRLLSPGPVTLLTSQYRGQPNIMAVAWAAPLSLDPPLIGVAIHPVRLTHEFVSKTDTFALNVPHLDLIAATHKCGTLSGREVEKGDKFVAAGLTQAEPAQIDPPLIAECIGHLECMVIDRVSRGDHDFFIAQVVALSADEESFDGFWKTDEEGGHILHHLGGDRYAALARSYRA